LLLANVQHEMKNKTNKPLNFEKKLRLLKKKFFRNYSTNVEFEEVETSAGFQMNLQS
jgi:hypothetical protein